ncbi:MAG: menaquinone biosynthesis protein, partial [bacterium]|nr:menaquinone biosynthesis protein [bacterium]
LDPQSIADCGLRIADCKSWVAGYDNSEIRNPKSEIGTIRNPKSAIGTIRNPQSEIRNRNDPKSVIVGKINYLNAVPFYLYLTGPHFYSLPLSPRQMGEFAKESMLDAGPFSLIDYFSLEDEFQLMDFCIAARDQVRSVILFSKKPIEELDGARIGITTETSTSVRLLELLLKKRYGLQPQLERLSDCGLRIADYGLRSLDSDSFPGYDAVLLIGDKALKGMADGGLRIADCGIKGRPQLETRYQYDLATLWWEWMRLPFVFAVWSVRASLPENIKSELHQRLEESLEAVEQNPGRAVLGYRHRLGLEENEVIEYLKGFFYRLGEKEREAINTFRTLILPFQH